MSHIFELKSKYRLMIDIDKQLIFDGPDPKRSWFSSISMDIKLVDEENKEMYLKLDNQDLTKWDMVDRIGNVYNRLIMYRGDLFHVSLDYFGRGLEDGRLFQTFFFNTEK
jgi:hypothetical protein